MLPSRRSLQTLESWLWTGPVGHLAGGALDFAAALSRYATARMAASRAGRRRVAEPRTASARPPRTGP